MPANSRWDLIRRLRVKALLYNPEGRGFDSRWWHWTFYWQSFRPHYGSGVDLASYRSEYQEYFLGGRGGGLRRPVRRADNLTTFMCRLSWNLAASSSWKPQGLSRPVMGLLYLYLLPVCILLRAAFLMSRIFKKICVISRKFLQFVYIFGQICAILIKITTPCLSPPRCMPERRRNLLLLPSG